MNLINGFFVDLNRNIKGFTSFKTVGLLCKFYRILMVLFVLALFDVMPYEYYIALRTMVCLVLGYAFLLSKNKPVLKYGALALIFLYNPIIPIHFGTQIVWSIINILTLFFIFIVRQERQKLE